MDLKKWNAKVEALAADLAALELDETLNPNIKQLLAKSMRSVIGAKTRGAKVPLGGSKLGGRPHAEKSFVWPTAKNVWNDRAIEPLALVAQLNLADLAVHDPTGLVPKTGRLLFFMLPIEYDPMSHRAYTHVVPAGPVVEHAPPLGWPLRVGSSKPSRSSSFPRCASPTRMAAFCRSTTRTSNASTGCSRSTACAPQTSMCCSIDRPSRRVASKATAPRKT